MNTIKTIEWKDDKVILLDQRKLPLTETYRTYEDYETLAEAIEIMVVRGAPAIGVTASFGVALGAMGTGVSDNDSFLQKMTAIFERLANTRPTAVNLFWALERMKKCLHACQSEPVAQIIKNLKQEALDIYADDIAAGKKLGQHGQTLLASGDTVLTHCNAGSLATAGFGSALSIIYSAVDAGKDIKVFADETRPRLQGANLTAWELQKNGVDVTVITDNMAASLMRAKKIQKIVVGADRIAANGDTANKIGTYSLAVLAKHHDIPFYVAAPLSTIDRKIPAGTHIPIEERSSSEVTHIGSTQLTPNGVNVINPAFDVTPAELISAIITEKGIVQAAYPKSIQNLFS